MFRKLFSLTNTLLIAFVSLGLMTALCFDAGPAATAAAVPIATATVQYTPSPVPTPMRTASPSLRPTTPAPKPTVHAVRHATVKATPTPRKAAPAHRVKRAPASNSRSSKRPALKHVATTGSARTYAKRVLSAAQYGCLDKVVARESGWRVTARNPYSGAYGLGQALPGSKMASKGADWRTNGVTQIRWVISYMNSRYGSPCGSWRFWQSHRWY